MRAGSSMRSEGLRTRTFGKVRVFVQEPDAIPEPFTYIDYAGVVTRIVDALREDDEPYPPMAVCLRGPSGVGKTAAAWAATKALKTECYTTQGATDCTAQDLVVFPVPTNLNRFDPVASGICTAGIEGRLALFDEIGKVARYAPEALTPLAAMLDDRRTLWSDFLKMPFRVRQGFGFICTAQNNEILPDYVTRRMLTFTIPPPPPAVLLEIMKVKLPAAPGLLMEAFRDWASLQTGLTPRDAGLIIHFAFRRARVRGSALSGWDADGLVREAAEAVCGEGEEP
ncbi:MAG: AAA family ATPase [Verrucomicrobiota bacterium]